MALSSDPTSGSVGLAVATWAQTREFERRTKEAAAKRFAPSRQSRSCFLDGLGGALDILFVDRDGTVADPSDGNGSIYGVLPIDADLDPAI